MLRRPTLIAGSAGLGVATVLAGVVLATTTTAAAATPCASAAPSSEPSATDSSTPAPTDSGTPSPSGSATPAPSGSASGSPSATPSPSGGGGLPGLPILPVGGPGQLGGSGQGTTSPSPTDTAGPTDTPTDTPSPTTSPVPFTFAIRPHSITKGKPATAFGKATPGCTVDLWAYTRPGTSYRKVRSTTASSQGTFSFTIYPGGNTRAFVRGEGVNDSSTDFVDVQEIVSIKASKLGAKRYRFAGGVGPADLQTVTVYNGKGQKLGSVATDGTGAWHLDHTFTATGTQTFYAVATKTQNNGAGTSPKISVTIS